MSLKPLTKEEKNRIGTYPIIDGDRKLYAKYVLQLSPRRFVCVRVLTTGGYLKIDRDFKNNPTIHVFKTEKEAQKACDIHNNWLFNTDTAAGQLRLDAIFRASFVNSRPKKKKLPPVKKYIVHVQFHSFDPMVTARTKREAMRKAVERILKRSPSYLVDKHNSSAEEW